jgi:hypothetical protein
MVRVLTMILVLGGQRRAGNEPWTWGRSFERAPMVAGGGLVDFRRFGRGEAQLGEGEDGGDGEETRRARNRKGTRHERKILGRT